MKPDARIFDDIAKLAGGAVNIASGMQQQIRDEIKARVEEMASRMDLVPREDFETIEGMVKKLRLEQEELKKRIEALEASQKATPKKATAKKTASKKTTSTKAKK